MIDRIFYRNHLVRKQLGQNFLVNQLIIDHIVTAINPKKEDVMVEIGPGLAALTDPICKSLNKLIVIELDIDLVKRLQKNPFLSSKLIIYQQDVMNVNFDKISKNFDQPLRIVGNIPYNISTSLIFYLFKYINVISDMHFMFQKEVANRLISVPNKKTYGRLSVIAQYYCHIIPVLEVPSNAFIPSPKVNSTLVRLIPRTINSYSELYALKIITTKAFSQRRKKICNSLINFLTIKDLTLLGIDPSMRAEHISVIQYCKIARYITSNDTLKQLDNI